MIGKSNQKGTCPLGSLMNKTHDMQIDYFDTFCNKWQLMCTPYTGIDRASIGW